MYRLKLNAIDVEIVWNISYLKCFKMVHYLESSIQPVSSASTFGGGRGVEEIVRWWPQRCGDGAAKVRGSATERNVY